MNPRRPPSRTGPRWTQSALGWLLVFNRSFYGHKIPAYPPLDCNIPCLCVSPLQEKGLHNSQIIWHYQEGGWRSCHHQQGGEWCSNSRSGNKMLRSEGRRHSMQNESTEGWLKLQAHLIHCPQGVREDEQARFKNWTLASPSLCNTQVLNSKWKNHVMFKCL